MNGLMIKWYSFSLLNYFIDLFYIKECKISTVSNMSTEPIFLNKVDVEKIQSELDANKLVKTSRNEPEIIDLNSDAKSSINKTNRANLMRNVQINSIISSQSLDQKNVNDDGILLRDISSVSLFSNSQLTPSTEVIPEESSNFLLGSSIFLDNVSEINTVSEVQSKSQPKKSTTFQKTTISSETILKKIKIAIKELQTVYDNRRSMGKNSQKYRLISDSQSAKKATSQSLTNWITVNEEEQINYWRNWNKNQQSAVILMDDNLLVNSVDVFYNHYSKLFTTHEGRVAFFWGKYKKHAALVKRIVIERKQFDQESLWINIAKKVSNEILQARSNANHPFSRYCPFAKIFEIYQQNCKQGTCLFVFMEVLTNKSLHYHIKQRRLFRVDELRRWTAQILNAIAYLQNRSIIHR